MPSAAASCRNHSDREAIGICVECRARVCSECVTKIDGINYCVSCLAMLADRGAREQREESRVSPRWLAHVSAIALFTIATLLAWGLLEAAMPGGG